jgi:hypothetical protein
MASGKFTASVKKLGSKAWLKSLAAACKISRTGRKNRLKTVD